MPRYPTRNRVKIDTIRQELRDKAQRLEVKSERMHYLAESVCDSLGYSHHLLRKSAGRNAMWHQKNARNLERFELSWDTQLESEILKSLAEDMSDKKILEYSKKKNVPFSVLLQ